MKPKLSVILCITGLMVGCDRSSSSSNPPASPTPPKSSQPPAGHKEGDGHDHSGDQHKEGDGHDHSGDKHDDAGPDGSGVDLGTVTVGDLNIRASRGAGEVKANGELHIDVWTNAVEGKSITVAAVRIWVGSQDAKGSIKSKAGREEANRWHGDAEAPAALAPDAKLWVEVETDKGTKAVGSFDLKR